ncbi:MAG TPA: AmmeMemoRadiSam system protein B [Candidatus Limnocylindria bacterium]|nr:AmmeMemoRadiSam system protein B [Candidatus Limnocylindria bacterium]
MPLDPSSDPPRPGRIIVPGQEPPETAESEAPAGGSRIVLPPGASREPEEELPEYPLLRPLELLPIREGDQDLLIVNDPVGVMPAPVALRIEAIDLLRLLDGTISLTDLTTEVVRGSKDLRAAAHVREFVAQLDRMLMLETPRFQRAYDELRRDYHRLEIRQAALAGVSYPSEPAELAAFLDRHFEEAAVLGTGASAPETDAEDGAGKRRSSALDPSPPATGAPRALMAPHLDPRRAGPAIARAILELDGVASKPLRVVVIGTGHSLLGHLFALTRKHFETPFGKLPCDQAFVDAVAERLGDAAYGGELAHRTEHSIEFQALYLRHRHRDRPVSLVPILCGGFHELLLDGKTPRDVPLLETLIAAVRDAEHRLGGRTVYLSAVDFSHVGPRFGDPGPDERTLREVEAKDREALEAAGRGDAEGWFRSIAAHEDSTRICGWAPTYVMLRCAEPGAGRLVHYHQSKEANGSMVSLAVMVWP